MFNFKYFQFFEHPALFHKIQNFLNNLKSCFSLCHTHLLQMCISLFTLAYTCFLSHINFYIHFLQINYFIFFCLTIKGNFFKAVLICLGFQRCIVAESHNILLIPFVHVVSHHIVVFVEFQSSIKHHFILEMHIYHGHKSHNQW